jgi:hypothetical protein
LENIAETSSSAICRVPSSEPPTAQIFQSDLSARTGVDTVKLFTVLFRKRFHIKGEGMGDGH